LTGPNMAKWLHARARIYLDRHWNGNIPKEYVLANNEGLVWYPAIKSVMAEEGVPYDHFLESNPEWYEKFVPGVGTITILSPRVGLIRLGTISSKAYRYEDTPQSGSRIRLSNLVHEGVHSDGNGPSLCFFHSECPAGHDFEGTPNCDEMSN